MAADKTSDFLVESHAVWVKRERKWHRKLEAERRWKWYTAGIPAVLSAIAAALIALWGHAQVIMLTLPVVLSLIGLRGMVASMRINEGKFESIWTICDRISVVYGSIIARLQDGENSKTLLTLALALEAEGRQGIPEGLRQTIKDASIPLASESYQSPRS